MIIFRTQVSEEIGFGHIKRSAYLASLIKKKNDVLFVFKKDKSAIRFLDEKKFKYILSKNLDQLNWDQVTGIVFDIRTIGQQDSDILRIAKEKKIKTVQITELGLCQLEVDVLINCSSDVIEPLSGVAGNVLNGPQFSIMHHKFIHFNNINKKYRKNVKNILISLGGGVKYRQLRDIIDILYRNNYKLKLTGGYYLKKSARKILKRIYPKIKFVGIVESLARPLYETDIAVIAAGTTSYEAAAVGTPALYFFYNKEQEFTADSLEKAGLGIKISNLKNSYKEKLLNVLDSITMEDRALMGTKGKQLVFGNGVYKIIDSLAKMEFIKK